MKKLSYYENLFEGLRLKLYNHLSDIIEDARYIVVNPDLHQTIRKVCDVLPEERPSIFGIELRLNNYLKPNEVKVVWYDRNARPVYYMIDDSIEYEEDILNKIWEREHKQEKKCKCNPCTCENKKSEVTVAKDADKKEITLTVNGSVVYNDFI